MAQLKASTRNFLEKLAKLQQKPSYKRMFEMPLWEARKVYRNDFIVQGLEPPGPDLVRFAPLPGTSTAGCVSCSCFAPRLGPGPRKKPPGLPVVLYLHGGGWTLGDPLAYEGFCRILSHRSQSVVVAPDYRLGPEHRCPAAAEDCFKVLEWISTPPGHLALEAAAERPVDTSRMCLSGDSAGGGLSLASSFLALERQRADLLERVRLLLLLCPGVDNRRDIDKEWPSMTMYSEGYLLTMDSMRWFSECYVGSDDSVAGSILASPVVAPESLLAQLPPTHIISTSHDPLVDMNAAMAERLRAAGVDTGYHCVEGQIHDFWMFGKAIPEADGFLHQIAGLLRDRLAPSAAAPSTATMSKL